MSALAVAITTLRHDGHPVRVDAIGGSSGGGRRAAGGGRRAELRERFARIADLEGKEGVDIEMISPLPQTDSTDGVTDL